MDKQFEILSKEIVYQGFFRVEEYRLKHTLFGGGWSTEIVRELFMRGSCVAVLLYDPDADKVVLIEQFRAGALLNPDKAWVVEIVAGAIEEGETAEQVAYRESMEAHKWAVFMAWSMKAKIYGYAPSISTKCTLCWKLAR
jgi:ADP-ribose pyrophosphatase